MTSSPHDGSPRGPRDSGRGGPAGRGRGQGGDRRGDGPRAHPGRPGFDDRRRGGRDGGREPGGARGGGGEPRGGTRGDDRASRRDGRRRFPPERGRAHGREDDRAYRREDDRAYRREDDRSRRREAFPATGDRPGRREHGRPAPPRAAAGPVEPALPDDIAAGDLAGEVRAELRSLTRPVAEAVARHLVAAGRLIDDDPEQALAHAVAARRRAARISAVREAVGLAAYHAGQWQTAIGELRTYHRMSGRQTHLAVLADCERALGRPDRAIDIYRTARPDQLDRAEAVELLIVAAGARGDLGQRDAAVAMLQTYEPGADEAGSSTARLWYAYADALLAAGRPQEAREWFVRAAQADEEAVTDAAERLLELEGVVLEEVELGDEAAEDGLAESADTGGPGAQHTGTPADRANG